VAKRVAFYSIVISVVLACTGWCDAEPLALTIIRDLDFGSVIGAPGEYDALEPAEIAISASVPAEVRLETSLLAYVGQRREFPSGPPTLDIQYVVTLVGERNYTMKQAQALMLTLEPEGEYCYTLLVDGTITINDPTRHLVGPYHGTITVTLSAR
jgi:hypothetical protein